MLSATFLLAFFPITSFAQSRSAEGLYQEGVTLLEAKKYDEAVAAFEAALKLQPKHEGAYQKRADAYRAQVTTLMKSAEFEAALLLSEQVLATAIRSNDFIARRKVLYQKGSAYFRLSRYPEALETFQHSLDEARLARERAGESDALNGMGLVYRATSDYSRAISCLEQSAAIYRELSDKLGEGLAFLNLGDVHSEMSDYERAMQFYEEALKLLRAAQSREDEAAALSSMASIHAYHGDFAKSLELDKLALKIAREVGDRSSETARLGNIGLTYIELGNYWQALEYLKRALVISTAIGDKYFQQNQMGGLGTIYQLLGDYVQSAEFFGRAQTIAHEIGNLHEEAIWIGEQGEVWRQLGRIDLAVQNLARGLAICDSLDDKRGQAIYSANLAAMHVLAENYQKARPLFERALALHQEIENNVGIGETYNGMGDLHRRTGEFPAAKAAHQQALLLGKRMHAQKIIWEAQFGLAQTAQRESKLAEARKRYSEAIATVEAVRGGLVSAEQKAYFLSNRDEIYKGLIHTLYRMHQRQPDASYDLEAFYFSEKAKARALLDLLAETKVQPSLPSDLQRRQDAALQQIAALQTQLQQNAPPDSLREALLAKVEQAESALQDVIIEIKQKNPAYAQLQYPEAVQLRDFRRQILDDNALVLAYALGEESSYLWALTNKQQFFLPLPPAAELTKAVNSYLTLIDTPMRLGVPHQARGRELSDLLLKPISDWVARSRKIIIIADGALHNLPFEALLTPNAGGKPQYLIEHAEIVYAPSATVLSFLNANHRARRLSQTRALLAFADPIFDADEFVKEQKRGLSDSLTADSLTEVSALRGWYEHLGKKFGRLPFTAAEIDSITQFFPSNAKKIYRREEALEERLKQEDLKRYAFLHFATHGVLDERHPGRSSLVLTLDDEPSEDGFVQINEIFNLKLEAELVVLSACETATGQRLPGEGLLGMSRAFLYAGAQSVLGSLWSVADDASTPRLMATFYRNMRRGKNRSAALRLAKLELINGKTASHRHPFYWAAFVLMGSEK